MEDQASCADAVRGHAPLLGREMRLEDTTVVNS